MVDVEHHALRAFEQDAAAGADFVVEPLPGWLSIGKNFRGERQQVDTFFKDLEAKVRIFNFSDKDVTRVSMTLDYLDGSGKKLKGFPWGMGGMPNVVPAKGTKVDEVGAFLPPETKKVQVHVKSVEFKDGSKWEAACRGG